MALKTNSITKLFNRNQPKNTFTVTFVRTTSGQIGFINKVYMNDAGYEYYSCVPVQRQYSTYVARYDRSFGAWAGSPADGGEIAHQWTVEWVNDGAAV